MVVSHTHIDAIDVFSIKTVKGFECLFSKASFHALRSSQSRVVDIEDTVQQQCHGGGLRFSDIADIFNLSILRGECIIDALSQVVAEPDCLSKDQRAFIILADMTSKGIW